MLSKQTEDSTSAVMRWSARSATVGTPRGRFSVFPASEQTMEIRAVFPPKGRDLRLDLLRGIANWAIFLNHMPNNAVNWITTRNYGFSDGADLFVYISGYTAALVFGRMMRDHGFLIGATRLWRRVWHSEGTFRELRARRYD